MNELQAGDWLSPQSHPLAKAETLGEHGFSPQQAHLLQKHFLSTVDGREEFFQAGPSSPSDDRWQARRVREHLLDQQLEFCERFQSMPIPKQEAVLGVVARIPGPTAALFVREAFEYYPQLRNLAVALLVFRLIVGKETEHLWPLFAWLQDQRRLA